VQLTTETGCLGYGEIAPIPWFGTETLEEAIALCQQLPQPMTLGHIYQIPPTFPATQFGLESAWFMAQAQASQPSPIQPSSWSMSHLLPTGKAALEFIRQHPIPSGTTLKWKMGVTAATDELAWFQTLVHQLPPDITLRLDANGGLTRAIAHQWLEECDRVNTNPDLPAVELLEQPLPPNQLTNMQRLSHQFQTAIALDESVTTLAQLADCYDQGWRGIVVIKPAITGFPSHLIRYCCDRDLDVVWSSALETAIARQFIETILIPSVGIPTRALGFGVDHWFNDARRHQSQDELWMAAIPI
jgi:O-succinylbenzoate synthase